MKKIYLAIPYSGMKKSSYEQANLASAILIDDGYNVFSPITHSHPLHLVMPEIRSDWEFWEEIDKSWIDVCDELWIVVPEEGYERVINSKGVQSELYYAFVSHKPVQYITINKFDRTWSNYPRPTDTTKESQSTAS